MGGFPVGRCGFARVDEDVHEEKGSVGGGLFDGADEVFSRGVEVVEESIRVIFYCGSLLFRRQQSVCRCGEDQKRSSRQCFLFLLL